MNIQKPSRELSVEETMSWTLDIYLNNFTIFFIPFLAATLFSQLLSKLLLDPFAGKRFPINDPSFDIAGFVLAMFALLIVVALLSWIVGAIVHGICVKCASDIVEKGKTNLTEAAQFTVGKLLSLLGASLLVGIIVGLGLIALILPGILLAIILSLYLPIIITENSGAVGSLSRSTKLVNNRWLKTFFIFLIIVIIIMFVLLVGNLITGALETFGWIISAVISAIVQPLIPIAMTVHYYSMWAREQALKPPPPPPPPF